MLTMMVVVKVRLEKREEFVQAMRALSSDREKQKGLRKSTLYREIDDQTGFSLVHEWETQEDLERYLGGEKFRVLLGALKVLGEKSEISCRHISERLSDLARGV